MTEETPTEILDEDTAALAPAEENGEAGDENNGAGELGTDSHLILRERVGGAGTAAGAT